MKIRNRLFKYVAPTAAVLFVPTLALAGGGTDYDSIVAAVDWGDVVTGIAAIAALIAGVLVVRKGVRMLLGMIK